MSIAFDALTSTLSDVAMSDVPALAYSSAPSFGSACPHLVAVGVNESVSTLHRATALNGREPAADDITSPCAVFHPHSAHDDPSASAPPALGNHGPTVLVTCSGEELPVSRSGPLIVGCQSAASLRHRRVYQRHLQFAFEDGVLQVKALKPGCSLLRSGSTDYELLAHRACVPLSHGDNVSLFYEDEQPMLPLTVRLSAPLGPCTHTSAPDPRDYDTLLSRVLVAERHSRMLQFDNDRLRSQLDSALMAEHRYLDLMHTALARREDALELRRARDEGIFCGCCARLRLPDHFFPAMLASKVPPARRRCALCVHAVRSTHDLFGREFFMPSGFVMPSPQTDDLRCLSQLTRCPACASMHHPCMFSMHRGANVVRSLLHSAPLPLRAPIPRDAERVTIHSSKSVAICVFCRRSQRRAQPEPRPRASAPLSRTWRWQPNPDDPGCSSGSDSDGNVDDVDALEDF